ncbi:gamma-tubulin complex component [Brachionus plicatilis]|uniref:Gamma-tubulin complex component n=1 Tax=Brachionus plicatilis TaxID=10195 RepID=A0A3M7PK58_BRAPC|nr:gamma-tubulin complex component [Brachionus plicatilis]
MKDKVLKGTSSGIYTLSPTALTSISKLALSEKSKSRRKETKLQIYPEYPSWMHERLNLTWDFYPNPEKFEIDCEVNKLTLSVQEDMIVDDLLNCMSGFEGKFIKTPSLGDKHAERIFHIERSLDPAMRELAKRILPVCSHYSLIIRFVQEKSEFKWGLVNHALCASIRELLKNHFVFICQLENLQRKGNLSLQKLWYYVNPIMGFMDILASIIKVINKGDCCGSAVIDILYEKVLAYSGDPKLQELIFYLAQTTSRPYFEMLQDWIFKGQINDPYNEFMISEDKDITKEKLKDDFNEKFWEKKYSINSQNIPKFLAAISEKILLTGKYLNSIFETGSILGKDVNSNELVSYEKEPERFVKKSKRFDLPEPVVIHFTIKEEVYKQIVENAYNFSSKILLNLLLKDHRLIDRLRSLKHYFLLDQSDFMVHFMDISEEELNKTNSEIRLNKIESLLEVSLRITSANSDPYKDDLRCKLLLTDLKSMVMKIQGITQKNELNFLQFIISFSL